MTFFNGRWKKVSVENVDAIVAVVAPKDNAEATAKLTAYFGGLDQVEEYKIDGISTHRKVYIGGELKRESTNEFNKESVVETGIGKTSVHGKLVSDSRIEVTEKSDTGRVGETVMSVEGSQLTITYTVNGVTLTRVYQRE